MSSRRILAKGSLQDSSDIVRHFPTVPSYPWPIPPSMRTLGVTFTGTKEEVERFKSKIDRIKEDDYLRELAAAESRAWRMFHDYLLEVRSLCLGCPRGQEVDPGQVLDELAGQVPGWASFKGEVSRLERLVPPPLARLVPRPMTLDVLGLGTGRTFLGAISDLTSKVSTFLETHYRTLPEPPVSTGADSWFKWTARRKHRTRWDAYERYLDAVAACLEPPLVLKGSLDAKHHQLGCRIPGISTHTAAISAIAAGDRPYLEDSRSEERRQLVARFANSASQLVAATEAMDHHLRVLARGGRI